MRALIVDPGGSRSALAGCRALGRAGWFVGVAAPDGRTIAGRSRFVRRVHAVPSAATGEEGFAAGVAAAVQEGGYEVVLPAGDAEAVVLSACRDAIPAVVPYAAHDVVRRAFDKQALAEVAEGCGILVPGPASDGEFPVVVKSRTHAAHRLDAVVATTPEELATALHAVRDAGAEPLVQALVPGLLVAVATVVGADGGVLATVHQQASRLWPPGAGVSTRAETVVVDPAVDRATTSLLGALGWFGLAELQFLLADDGMPRLIDFNGRLYGSLALAEAAGVNLPVVWASAALGLPLPDSLPVAAAGRRYQWLEGDLRRAAVERRGGAVRDVATSLTYALGARHSIVALDDPVPALVHGLDLARRAWRKVHR